MTYEPEQTPEPLYIPWSDLDVDFEEQLTLYEPLTTVNATVTAKIGKSRARSIVAKIRGEIVDNIISIEVSEPDERVYYDPEIQSVIADATSRIRMVLKGLLT